MAEQGALQITSWLSRSMVYVESGSNHRLTTWFMEALKARFLWVFFIPATVQDWWWLPLCVRDIGANSVKAKKQLDVSVKAPFTRFQYQNIATLFDPPHLLKCAHSHFPKQFIVKVG
jgi:hypothetical protein